MHYHVLIVDDEIMLASMTAEYFNTFDINTFAVETAKDCLDFLKENEVELILLDINLTQSNGFDLCKVIRQEYDTPIFFISARVSTDDMLIALNIGGDDYITKPYELSVLLAKVKVRLKREENSKNDSSIVMIDNMKIDYAKMKAYLDGSDLELNLKEFKLLAYLTTNKNKVVMKDEILKNVWGDTYISDGALNVQISRLREKIEKMGSANCIKTVWGQGYLYESKGELH